MKLKAKAVGKRLVIQRLETELEENEFGLVLTDQQKDNYRMMRGIVVSKGALVSDEINVGDTVVFDRYSGTESGIKGLHNHSEDEITEVLVQDLSI